MLQLILVNSKPVKYRVYDNDVYLVGFTRKDMKDVAELPDVVHQAGCTGCTFRPNDRNCAMAMRGLSMMSCITDANVYDHTVYMRDDLIYQYETKMNVSILSPNLNTGVNLANRENG